MKHCLRQEIDQRASCERTHEIQASHEMPICDTNEVGNITTSQHPRQHTHTNLSRHITQDSTTHELISLPDVSPAPSRGLGELRIVFPHDFLARE